VRKRQRKKWRSEGFGKKKKDGMSEASREKSRQKTSSHIYLTKAGGEFLDVETKTYSKKSTLKEKRG